MAKKKKSSKKNSKVDNDLEQIVKDFLANMTANDLVFCAVFHKALKNVFSGGIEGHEGR